MKICLSTGLFSRNPDLTSFSKVQQFISKHLDFNYELLIYPDWTNFLHEYAKDINKLDLPIVGIHTDKRIAALLAAGKSSVEGINVLTENLAFAEAIHCRYAVIHLWEHPFFESNLQETLEHVNIIAKKTLKRTVLSFETAPTRQISIQKGLRIALKKVPNSQITLDTELFSWRNDLHSFFEDDVLSSKLNNIHIRDFDGRAFDENGKRKYLLLGSGNLDFNSFFKTLKHINYEGTITLENSAVDQDGNVSEEVIFSELKKIEKYLGVR